MNRIYRTGGGDNDEDDIKRVGMHTHAEILTPSLTLIVLNVETLSLRPEDLYVPSWILISGALQ